MSTINEATPLIDGETATPVTTDTTVPAAAGAADTGVVAPGQRDDLARPSTDGADDGELERELEEMEKAATTLHKEGIISDAEVEEKREQVARTRKLFKELPPEERAAIIRRRREIGRELMQKQLSGAAVVSAVVRLNHTRLKPLFEQWWPYLNRMSINMQRFGRSTFGVEDQEVVTTWLEAQLKNLEEYVAEQLEVARGFRERTEATLRESGDIVFSPTITKPSLVVEVEAYTRFSYRLLTLIMKFDQVMDHFDFLVWNGLRDQSDVDEETGRFLGKFHPIGLRGYMTHLRLMTTVRGR
ncbi:ATPase [Burkholderia vietnamiensis]|uniref:ATPase n=1 Tax=Burkholderia vietnamiensis TaxID=60552 RepID=UPI001ADC9F39|nr:ATPase [Burkholderia vietnamiensis]MBR8191557.1 ATPase [Burkholderia vietnamiensis]QTK86109.1 ATPase [Burkholderia vietnamiensis]